MKTGPKFWAMGLLLSAFGVGTAFGGVVSTAWGDDEDGERRGRPGGYSEMMARELGLSDSQQDSVAAILETSRPEMCEIWQEYRPRFDTLRSTIRTQIRELLDEEQQVLHQELMARHDSLRAAKQNAADSTGNRNGC
jgi:hypothetical protein